MKIEKTVFNKLAKVTKLQKKAKVNLSSIDELKSLYEDLKPRIEQMNSSNDRLLELYKVLEASMSTAEGYLQELKDAYREVDNEFTEVSTNAGVIEDIQNELKPKLEEFEMNARELGVFAPRLWEDFKDARALASESTSFYEMVFSDGLLERVENLLDI